MRSSVCLSVDARLPMLTDNTMRTLLNIAIYTALIAAILPWFLLLIPVAGAALVLVYAVFRVGIRRLQRFQLESMAPLLTHVDASVRGLASVHAYDRAADFQLRCVQFSPLVFTAERTCSAYAMYSPPHCTSITPSLFHSRLETYLFHKSYPPP